MEWIGWVVDGGNAGMEGRGWVGVAMLVGRERGGGNIRAREREKEGHKISLSIQFAERN